MTFYLMYWFYGIGQKQKTGCPQPVFPLFQEDEIQYKDNEQPVHNRVNAFSFSFADHCNRVENKADRNPRRNAVRQRHHNHR